MDNLPNDPSNPNNGNNNNPPPPFGSGFTPHTNPIDPNNPYTPQPPQNPNPAFYPPPIPLTPASPAGEPTSPNYPNLPDPPDLPKDIFEPEPQSRRPDSLKHEHYSEAAQEKIRDEHGRFLHSEQTSSPPPQTTPTSPNTQTNLNSSNLPPLIETNPKQDSKDEDPPLIKITNPVTYFKRWWKKIMAKEGIDFKMGFRIKPVTAVLIASIIITGGVSSGVTAFVLKTFFPTSSPILHRQIIQQGTIQTGTGGFYLASSDQSIWKLKPKKPNVNLNDQVGKQVTVTGNLTKEASLIEVSEIILSDSSQTPLAPRSPALPDEVGPNIPNQDLLPKLYSDLTWEVTQSKVLLFTSGKRRIEQEGVYLESSELKEYPQAFLDYYTQALQTSGFKQTLNSSNPDGVTLTYAKDELFSTFGIKNVYSGSGDKKQLVGYRAYIEHN